MENKKSKGESLWSWFCLIAGIAFLPVLWGKITFPLCLLIAIVLAGESYRLYRNRTDKKENMLRLAAYLLASGVFIIVIVVWGIELLNTHFQLF